MSPGEVMKIAREGREILRQEGMAAFIRKALRYCLRPVYWHREWYLWRYDAGDAAGTLLPDEGRYELKVVSTQEDLEALLTAGYAVGEPFVAENPGKLLAERKVGLFVFEQKYLVCWGWVVMEAGAGIFPPVRDIDYATGAYLCHLITAPRARGMGLGTYMLRRRLEYAKGKGKSVVVLATLKDNPAAVRIQEKVGLRRYGEIKLTRVLGRESWTQRRYEGP
jgi:ribosomal protein S18 acetylase RimI-like enzyme